MTRSPEKRSTQIRRALRAHRLEMRMAGIPVIASMNRLEVHVSSANGKLQRLKLELAAAIREESVHT